MNARASLPLHRGMTDECVIEFHGMPKSQEIASSVLV